MEDIYIILSAITIFAIGYYIGTYNAVMKMLSIFKDITGKELDLEDLIEEEEDVKHLVTSMLFVTETINNTLYLYNLENNTFVCQGLTLEELCVRCLESTKLDDMFVVHEKETYHYNGECIEKVEHEN